MPLSYETAKKLKDAGFSQKLYTGATFYPDAKSNERVWSDDTESFVSDIPEVVKTPILEELIEECGENFVGVNLVGKYSTDTKWKAIHCNIGTTYAYGPTPKEAVANLYLALNPKK